ncbi:hypothetical protein [Marinomonas rhodophyticola]|uniref:Uncharacterized protein n=1 Tax=Marinomonas rhodophyticola TaxID=2992803 RepID=A0ABT3KBK7_9GAMM|nr:hypothetical protein [Marinomonas sp. KJ51-3]MCW4627921.1 hypothetical protein [Marinomonas sp. KJ51-3]
MENIILVDFFHLTVLATTVCCFLVISSKRVIELCSQTQSGK